jgi:tRNA G18 (ribose-2'-O)-methylase SpoU
MATHHLSRFAPKPVGAQHPRIRELLILRRNAPPSSRRIVVEGAWEHERVLDSGTAIGTVLWCPEAASDRSAEVAERVAERADEVFRISERLLTRLARLGRPDGLLSVVELPAWPPEDLRIGRSSLVLVADGLEYAGNLGTLIRTVDAARADCLVLTSRRARLTHPAVYAASRGLVLTTPVLEFGEIGAAAGWLRRHGFAVHLADPAADRGYRSIRYDGPTAFVVGSEGKGLGPGWYRQGFGTVSIPMLGLADSLNVALSAGLLLFEARARMDGW